MTLSNIPRDGEPIAEAKAGPLGETLFIPTRMFLRFLEDLTELTQAVPDASPELNVAISRLKSVQRDADAYLAAQAQETQHLKALLAAQAAKINDLTQRIQNLEQTQ